MTVKKTQALQDGSGKVGAGKGREKRAEMCQGGQVVCADCWINTSHISCCLTCPMFFLYGSLPAVVWSIIKGKGQTFVLA